MEEFKARYTGFPYNYEFVLPTNQDSIDATMKKYMDGLNNPVTYMCVKYDQHQKRNVSVNNYEEYAKSFGGVDPFAIPKDINPEGNKDLDALDKQDFVAAIKITLGLPQNYSDRSNLPKFVDSVAGEGSVICNMLCANIQITELIHGANNKRKWVSLAQNNTPNVAWVIQSHLNLRTSPTEPDRLPQDIKDKIKNLNHSRLDLQQLHFDLEYPNLSAPPRIEGLDGTSEAGLLLTKYFVDAYFKLMRNQGQPILNYLVSQDSQK